MAPTFGCRLRARIRRDTSRSCDSDLGSRAGSTNKLDKIRPHAGSRANLGSKTSLHQTGSLKKCSTLKMEDIKGEKDKLIQAETAETGRVRSLMILSKYSTGRTLYYHIFPNKSCTEAALWPLK